MDDLPERNLFSATPSSLKDDREGVPARELICGPLRALRDNRAEAEALLNAPAAQDAVYKPGLYSMMDWVASRLSKAGAALWAYLLGGEPLEWLTVEWDLFQGLELDLASSAEVECLTSFVSCII